MVVALGVVVFVFRAGVMVFAEVNGVFPCAVLGPEDGSTQAATPKASPSAGMFDAPVTVLRLLPT